MDIRHHTLQISLVIFGIWWGVVRLINGVANPECRTFVGPENFLDLQPELDPTLHGGLVIFGEDLEIQQTGLLTTWQFVTDAENGTFYLDVWRPQSGGDYKLIKSHLVNLTGSGFQVVNLGQNNRVPVQSGDRLGMHFSLTNVTVTQMLNTSALCLTGSVDDTPPVDENVASSLLTQIECAFAVRTSIHLQNDPCGHLYYGTNDLGIRTEQTISVYAETLGVCSLKCLNEKSCVGFTFRRVITEEGKRTNVCDLNSARIDDEVETIPDDGNYTDYVHFD